MRQMFVKFVQCCCMIGAAILVSHALWAQTQPNREGAVCPGLSAILRELPSSALT